jgi:hypothetical protein
MPSIFQVGDTPCGIFAPQDGESLWTTVSFARTAAAQYASNPTQTPGGEVLQSFINIGPYTGWLIPNHGGLERTEAGVIINLVYDFIVPGVVDLREGDRAYVNGRQIEIVAPNQFGQDHLEAQMKWLGR